MSTYTPTTIDTFHIGVEEGVATVLIQGSLPIQCYQALYTLCFSVYAPVALTINIEDREQVSYTIAQSENLVDLNWLAIALSRFEQGWTRQGNALFSPTPSQLPQKQIIDIFNAARVTPAVCVS
jgi:hypothetical protein